MEAMFSFPCMRTCALSLASNQGNACGIALSYPLLLWRVKLNLHISAPRASDSIRNIANDTHRNL